MRYIWLTRKPPLETRTAIILTPLAIVKAYWASIPFDMRIFGSPWGRARQSTAEFLGRGAGRRPRGFLLARSSRVAAGNGMSSLFPSNQPDRGGPADLARQLLGDFSVAWNRLGPAGVWIAL